MATFWCIASSTLGQAFLGLLGPTIVVWLWRIVKAKSFYSSAGPRTDITLANQYVNRAKWGALTQLPFWALSCAAYLGTYVSVEGKGCDAEFNDTANSWLLAFQWSLLPLGVTSLLVSFFYFKFQEHDELAREQSRS